MNRKTNPAPAAAPEGAAVETAPETASKPAFRFEWIPPTGAPESFEMPDLPTGAATQAEATRIFQDVVLGPLGIGGRVYSEETGRCLASCEPVDASDDGPARDGGVSDILNGLAQAFPMLLNLAGPVLARKAVLDLADRRERWAGDAFALSLIHI